MNATKARISVPTKAAVRISWSLRPEAAGDPSDAKDGATNGVITGPAFFKIVPPWAGGSRTPPAMTSSGVSGTWAVKLGCAVHGPAAGIKTAQIVGATYCWAGAVLGVGLSTTGSGAPATVAVGLVDVVVGRISPDGPFELLEEDPPTDVLVLPDVSKLRRMSLQEPPPVVLVLPEVLVSPDVELVPPEVLVSPDVELVPPDVELVPPEVLASPEVELVPPDVELVPPDVELVPPDVELVPPDVELVPPEPSSPSAFVNTIDGGPSAGG